jgi:acetoacetate decarboxylase
MARTGRLTLDKMGYSMPVNAPAYQAPPYHYRNAQAIFIKFETDLETALDALPSPLELTEPATAILSFYWYPFTTFGPYHEVQLRLYAQYEGKGLTYVHQIFVDTDPPLLAGREILGFPKKIATIGFRRERDMICGTLERPGGVRLATAIMRPEQPIGDLPSSGPTTGLRIIPSDEPGTTPPALAEILANDIEYTTREAWEGPGSISFPDHSALDPVNIFPVRRVLKAIYSKYDVKLPAGRVIARL